MKTIIKELESSMQHELNQIGMTPRTLFIGNQADHDKYHSGRAKKYGKAISILKSYKSK
jgi:hypothetical protein